MVTCSHFRSIRQVCIAAVSGVRAAVSTAAGSSGAGHAAQTRRGNDLPLNLQG